jgi:hypothetical protein
VSVPALTALTPDVIAQALQDTEVLGKEMVLARLSEIWRQYVVNVSPATQLAFHQPDPEES